MKVSELIEILQQYDDDCEVILTGGQDGLGDWAMLEVDKDNNADIIMEY